MLDTKPVTKIMFLDIETTSMTETFAELDERFQNCFLKKFKKRGTEELIDGIGPDGKKYTKAKLVELKEKKWSELAPLSAMFGRILCISVGYLVPDPQNGGFHFRKMSFYNDDEKILLDEFINSKLKRYMDNPMDRDGYFFCAYNGIVFDYPFIVRRLVINGFDLPPAFDYSEKKPWEILHLLDPKKTWQLGVFADSESLETLCAVFNVPTPKDGIDGSQVKNVYWEEKNLEKIKNYCERDVFALAKIYLKMKTMKEEIRDPAGE